MLCNISQSVVCHFIAYIPQSLILLYLREAQFLNSLQMTVMAFYIGQDKNYQINREKTRQVRHLREIGYTRQE